MNVLDRITLRVRESVKQTANRARAVMLPRTSPRLVRIRVGTERALSRGVAHR